MALTDKSMIALTVRDLRVVEGERCLLDRRLNLRLGYDRDTYVRRLIERNKKDFEVRWGTLRRSDAKSTGGRPGEDYWLTKGQALWVCRKSDARNADDVMEEVIKVFLAVDAGAPIPDTPWTDALFAPDTPTITHGEGNVVHVKHEDWTQPSLFDAAPPPEPADKSTRLFENPDDPSDAPMLGDHEDITARITTDREHWQEQYLNIDYATTLRRVNGNPWHLRFLRAGSNNAPNMTRFYIPTVPQMMLAFDDPNIPREVIDSALDRLGLNTRIVKDTLDGMFN